MSISGLGSQNAYINAYQSTASTQQSQVRQHHHHQGDSSSGSTSGTGRTQGAGFMQVFLQSLASSVTSSGSATSSASSSATSADASPQGVSADTVAAFSDFMSQLMGAMRSQDSGNAANDADMADMAGMDMPPPPPPPDDAGMPMSFGDSYGQMAGMGQPPSFQGSDLSPSADGDAYGISNGEGMSTERSGRGRHHGLERAMGGQFASELDALIQQLSASSTTSTTSTDATTIASTTEASGISSVSTSATSTGSVLESSFSKLISALGGQADQNSLKTFLQTLQSNLQSNGGTGNMVNATA